MIITLNPHQHVAKALPQAQAWLRQQQKKEKPEGKTSGFFMSYQASQTPQDAY
jgi:hypothetical protein